MVDDHYEVKVDGEWVRVSVDTINNVIAPDGGAHVCAPRQEGRNKGVLYCVIRRRVMDQNPAKSFAALSVRFKLSSCQLLADHRPSHQGHIVNKMFSITRLSPSLAMFSAARSPIQRATFSPASLRELIMVAGAHNRLSNACDTVEIFENNERLCPKVNIGCDIESIARQYNKIVAWGRL